MIRPTHSFLVAGLAAITVSAGGAATELLAPAAQAAAPAAQVAATSVPHLLSCAGSKLTRPQETVVLACGDGGIEIQNTHWSSWTGTLASGTTTLDINLCKPTCVQSKMRSFPGSSVRLRGVAKGSTGLVFTRATIIYRNAGREATVTAYPRT